MNLFNVKRTLPEGFCTRVLYKFLCLSFKLVMLVEPRGASVEFRVSNFLLKGVIRGHVGSHASKPIESVVSSKYGKHQLVMKNYWAEELQPIRNGEIFWMNNNELCSIAHDLCSRWFPHIKWSILRVVLKIFVMRCLVYFMFVLDRACL